MPPLGAVASDPGALQAIIAGALAGASASIGALAGGEVAVLEHGIRMKAETDAPGMKPEGPLLSAKLAAGGHAQGTLVLSPGRCYTVVGFGAPGVFDFEINLITAPPLPPQVVAQSGRGRADPTLGRGDQCIRNPLPAPMPVKVDLHLLRGQGLVGAQAFVK